MTAGKALGLALRQRMKDDADYGPLSNGIFVMRAPSATPLPYTTFMREPAIPIPTLRTTVGWKIKVQVKHWAEEKAGQSAGAITDELSELTGAMFHARDEPGLGTSCQGVLDALNALSMLNGWQFTNAEIVTDIPPYLDKIGDKEVWCQGHRFEFWLTKPS